MSASTNIADACHEMRKCAAFLSAVAFKPGIAPMDRMEIQRISGRLQKLTEVLVDSAGLLTVEAIQRRHPLPFVRWCIKLDELLEAEGFRKEDVEYETMFMQGFYPEEVLIRLEKGVGDV